MPPRNRDRRFPINLPLLKEIRLALWAHTEGVSKTRKAEALVIAGVGNDEDWDAVCRDLLQEAEIKQLTVEDLIKEVLAANAFDEAIDIDNIDWSCLIEGLDPEIESD